MQSIKFEREILYVEEKINTETEIDNIIKIILAGDR